jgi:tetratricopeptide (TPR) repeat protein
VIVGDHGEALGEHGELTHGLLLYQPTLHVPMLVTGPEIKPRVVREPVSSVDLAPTIAALAGIELPNVDGHDLSAVLKANAAPPAADVYAETQYPLTFGWSELSALRRGTTKLIAGPAPELYDLARDPGERTNILAAQRRPFRELATRLDVLRATAVASTQPTVDEETKRKLASLGYIAPAPAPGAGARPDPKAMAPLFLAFEKALAISTSKHPRGALAPLAELVRRDPANPVFRATLARVQRLLGESGEAVSLLRETVALAPQDADAWYNLGVALTEAGKADEAIAALTESARLDPRRAATQNALGILYIQRRDAPTAGEAFQRAVALDPRDPRGWNNLANAMRALGAADQAAANYKKAIALAPDYADPHNGLGVLLVQQRQAGQALPYFKTALRLQPDFYEARLNYGIALQELRLYAVAAAQYQQLLAELPPGAAFDDQRTAARTLLQAIPHP